jgi:hypothetical protein
MSPGTALGFFWALGGVDRHILPTVSSLIALAAAAERKELYRFSVDLGKLALRIVERHGTNADRWYASFCSITVHTQCFFSRSLVMYCSMVSAFDNVHIRSNLPRLEEAIKYADSAGDRWVVRHPMLSHIRQSGFRVYASFANFYSVETKLFIGQPRKSCSLTGSSYLLDTLVDELVGAAEEVWCFPVDFPIRAYGPFHPRHPTICNNGPEES